MVQSHKHKNPQYLPRLIAWEVTRQCKLNCKHCRAAATSGPYPNELSTEECLRLLDKIAAFAKPIIILTGGEPMLREDIFKISEYGTKLGLRMVIAPCGILITEQSVQRMKDTGIKRVSISLDGATKETHDRFRGMDGAFEATLKGIDCLKKVGLEFQINSTITKFNQAEIPAILDLAVSLGAVAFHPFLLVPTGRGKELADQAISPQDYENILNWFYDQKNKVPLQFKPTCAPHYYRILRQRAEQEGKEGTTSRIGKPTPPGHPLDTMTKGCLGGLSFCFISHTGIVQICGFMEVKCGDIRQESFEEIWNRSRVFQELRDPANYKGKCGHCEYLKVCGGCRARAYALTDDYLQEEPSCIYQPR